MRAFILAIGAGGLMLFGSVGGAGQELARGGGGVRRALVVCGLTGDADHRALFGETVETLYRGLTEHRGFRAEHVTVLWSESAGALDGPALSSAKGPATREALATTAGQLAKDLAAEDALWVVTIGHAHYDGRTSWLNLPGPDISDAEFGKLFENVACREQVFFMTTAASGFFIKPLSREGRVVISATEADREVNETLFPHKLAAFLAEPPPFAELDIDGDGRLSLFDAYLFVVRETAQDYATNMLLATEHARLDDNGDGKGSELQLDFLSEELGGRTEKRTAPVIGDKADGALARRTLLTYPPSPPGPVEQN